MFHMNKTFFVRATYNIVVLISLLSVSWWCTLFLCFGGVILFRRYYECVFAGILLDMLYGMPHEHLMDISLIFTTVTFVLFTVVYRLKTHVRYE